jgi:D-glycero-D-manno-heptose 1,7-bisphosphate phosphatase
MHELMRRALPVDVIKVCFHGHSDRCQCRKPNPGMLLEAASELGIDLERSYMVGDRASDVEVGRRTGCTTVFIDLDYAEPAPTAPDYIVHSVAEAADVIIEAALTMKEAS